MTSPGYSAGLPGYSAIRQSAENAVLFQSFFQGDVVFDAFQNISSTAVDTGNSPTSILRPGLVMAKLDSDGSWLDYDKSATDGSQEARGVLVQEVNLLDYTAAASAARLSGVIVIAGKIKAGSLYGLDQQARTQLAERGFRFDDNLTWSGFNSARRVTSKAADYTVLAADHGTRFLAITGAVVFTLPAIAVGLSFEFINCVDANMTVTSAEGDNVITDHDLSADSIAFSTAAHKIGGRVLLEAIFVAGTLKWLPVFQNAVSTNTATIAT